MIKPVYDHQGIQIYHGDSKEIMKEIESMSVDCIVTDPPYGIDFHSARPSEERKKDKIQNDGLVDYMLMLPWMFQQWGRILKDGGVCCCCGGGGGGAPSLAYLWIEAGKYLDVENVCIWDKGFVGMGWRYRFQWEAVLIATNGERKTWNGGNNKSNILEFQKVIPQEGDHPTPKPESLMRSLIEDNLNKGELILDPFMGSGTTLKAAKDLGRKAIGIEISEKYIEIAIRRLRQEVFPF